MTLRLIVDLNEPPEAITPEQAEEAARLAFLALSHSLHLQTAGFPVLTVALDPQQPFGF